MKELALGERTPAWWEPPLVRTVDVALASVALVVLALPLVLILILIRTTSRGPAVFRQERAGRHRRPFTMYKFRTMHLGADEDVQRDLVARELAGEDTRVDGSCKIQSDSRVTRVGGVLRRTSLDELPQLVNVVRGDMALVGPRPCLAWEAEVFPPAFASRFAVRPGLTGLWQISGRSTLTTLEMLALDVAYVRGRGIWTDLRILARTVPAMAGQDGAR